MPSRQLVAPLLFAMLIFAGCQHQSPRTSEGAGFSNQPTRSGNFPQPNHGEKSASLVRSHREQIEEAHGDSTGGEHEPAGEHGSGEKKAPVKSEGADSQAGSKAQDHQTSPDPAKGKPSR